MNELVNWIGLTHENNFWVRQVKKTKLRGRGERYAIRVLSSATTLDGARQACKTHLLDDGEEGPLQIYPDGGEVISTAHLLPNSRTVYFEENSLTKVWE